MMKRKLPKSANKDLGIRLLEYCKYLYEEEKERTYRLEKKVEIYTAFLGGGFWFVLTLLPPDRGSKLLKGSDEERAIDETILVVLFLSIFLFLFSSIFTILVYRVRHFEWLCNPEKRALDATAMKDENEFIFTIIADYTTASNRNHEINNKKARLLSKSIIFLMAGLICLALGLFLYNAMTFWKGGA